MVDFVQKLLLASSCMLIFLIAQVQSHGRLLDPPSRASMWRQGYANPHNYNDNQLFCGGVGVQYGENGGKCGVCGDPWNGPREHEAGGRFANGIIVRKYKVGQVINVTVELTANHKGYFEFHLCPSDNPFKKITHNCLDKFPLRLAENGEIRYQVNKAQPKYYIKLQLPHGIKCSACMLQWKYNAGNSWGTNADGTSCIGCGNQEQFYGCADVAIGHDEVTLGKPATKHPWYFQEVDTEWHYGIVTNNNKSKNGAESLSYTSVWVSMIAVVINMLIPALCVLVSS